MIVKFINKIPFGLTIVFFVSLLPLVSLLHPGLPLTHDGMDHVARIANFYKALSEGVIFPRWAENLNWGYGHPILMFLYPLSSYIASLFHFIGFSYIDSVKIVFGVGFVASGISMYMWAREEFNEYMGIASALLYLFAPYRFVDLYVRGAIGEHLAFIFPPLVLYFIYKYFEKKSRVGNYLNLVGISISIALLLLAHNAISLMFLPLLLAYALYLAFKTKNYKKLTFVISSFVWGFALSAFFTIPAFFEGKFTLRDIVTGNEYKDRFVTLSALLYGKWSFGITGQFSVQVGIANLIGILLFPFVLYKLAKNKYRSVFLVGVLIFLILSIFVMLPQSNFLYEIITTLKKFQFPWRFLSLTVFTFAIISSSIFLVIKKEKYKKIGLVLLIVTLFVTTYSYWNSNGYLLKSDQFYNGIYNGTTDTGESSPIWSIRFMEHRPSAHLETIEGSAVVSERERKTTKHSYTVSVNSSNARFRENTLYFPNWIVVANGKQQVIQFQDPSERGLITFTLPKGEYMLDIDFADTKLRIISNVISLVSIFAIFLFAIPLLRVKK